MNPAPSSQTVDDTPGEEVITRLQDQGLLPKTATKRAIDRSAINALAAGPVFAHLDPRHPYQDAKANLEVIRPSWFNTAITPPYVRVGNGGGVSYPLLTMSFSGLGANAEAVVSVDLKILGNDDTVQITATGNPIAMTVSYGAMGGQRGTVMVPVKATTGTAVVILTLPAPTDPFGNLYDWFGADLRKL